jgi:hypothetical protein
MASVLPTIEEGTWFLWNPLGNIYKLTFLWWQILLFGICSKISKLGLDVLFDLHIQLQNFPLGVNNDNVSLYSKGYNDNLSYFSIMFTPFSQPIKENTRQRFLNLGSNIKHSYLLNK